MSKRKMQNSSPFRRGFCFVPAHMNGLAFQRFGTKQKSPALWGGGSFALTVIPLGPRLNFTHYHQLVQFSRFSNRLLKDCQAKIYKVVQSGKRITDTHTDTFRLQPFCQALCQTSLSFHRKLRVYCSFSRKNKFGPELVAGVSHTIYAEL